MKIHINHSDLELDVKTVDWEVPVYSIDLTASFKSELYKLIHDDGVSTGELVINAIIDDKFECDLIIDNYIFYPTLVYVVASTMTKIKPISQKRAIENQFLAARLNEFLPTDTRAKTKSERILFESSAITTIKNALENIHV